MMERGELPNEAACMLSASAVGLGVLDGACEGKPLLALGLHRARLQLRKRFGSPAEARRNTGTLDSIA